MYLYTIVLYVCTYHCVNGQWLGRILTMIASWSEKDEVQQQQDENLLSGYAEY